MTSLRAIAKTFSWPGHSYSCKRKIYKHFMVAVLNNINFSSPGYDRSIPGIPRYSVLGSDNSGQFSLKIVNVSVADDADYECQVGPANYNKPIRAQAHLSVLREYKDCFKYLYGTCTRTS